MSIGWVVVLIICLIVVGSALVGGLTSTGGFIALILFAPVLIPIAILGAVAATKVVSGEPMDVMVSPYGYGNRYSMPPTMPSMQPMQPMQPMPTMVRL
jgi:hypothetical protein